MSFVATAIITFMAIVFGYLSDSLPDTCLSQLDRTCIAKFSTIRWRPWNKDGRMSFFLRRSMTVAMEVLGWDYAVADNNEGLEDDNTSRDARERRCKALEKFILALSDQQLVTGLAVLIAGSVSPCSMSLYHFNIIAALGWFSSTVHLSTLAVLREYFIEHPKIRNWRVGAMLLVLALLIIAQVFSGGTRLGDSLPVACAFIPGSSNPLVFLDIFSTAIIITFLIVTYSNRIVRLYITDPEWSVQEWFVDAVLRLFKKSPRLSICKILIESSNKNKVEQGVLWRSVKERRRYSIYYNIWKRRRLAWPLSKHMKPESAKPHVTAELKYSFLGDLLTLQFGVTFGITQVIVSRVYEPRGGIVGSQNEIDFGQLVPLLLMLLPLLAAGEAFFGNNHNLHAWELILIALLLGRREDMLTKPHGKPFFSRKVDHAHYYDFELSHSTQPTGDNTLHTTYGSSALQSPEGVSPSVDLSQSTQPTGDNTLHTVYASGALQSPEDVSPSVVGSIELQDLPTRPLRRPDTETGQSALTTGHTPAPENGNQPARATEKTPWTIFIFQLVGYAILQTLIAVVFGGAPVPDIVLALLIIGSLAGSITIVILGFVDRLLELRGVRHLSEA